MQQDFCTERQNVVGLHKKKQFLMYLGNSTLGILHKKEIIDIMVKYN